MVSELEKQKFKDVDIIVFDMDGVVTGESEYWCAAEMTVLELLYSKQYLGLNETSMLTALHKPGVAVKMNRFVSPQFIALLKNNGVNTNWDLAYVSLALYLIDYLAGIQDRKALERIIESPIDGDSLAEISKLIKLKSYPVEHIDNVAAYFMTFRQKRAAARSQKSGEITPEQRAAFFFEDVNAWCFERAGLEGFRLERNDSLWNLSKDIFQEWYLGDSLLQESGEEKISKIFKDGMIWTEEPIIPAKKLISCFGMLKEAGIKLGIATGRPYSEIMLPLHKWGMLNFFESMRISTYREIKEAEEFLEEKGIYKTLPKPNPYVYLRSIFPEKSTEELLDMKTPLEPDFTRRVLIVGDSLSDLMAAKTIGCLSAVVMTGVIDLETASLMKALKPDFILENVSFLEKLF